MLDRTGFKPDVNKTKGSGQTKQPTLAESLMSHYFRKLRKGEAGRAVVATRLDYGSETEPRLELYRPAAQCAAGHAEVGVRATILRAVGV
jgi:hypothetical protein